MDRFKLTGEQRARLRRDIDPDALERMVSRAPPEDRERLIGFFAEGSRASIVAAANPEMHALLRDVWAPAGGLPVENAFAPPAAPSIVVTLALAPELGSDAGAVVIRRPAGDVIVLAKAHANGAQLFQAISALSEDDRLRGKPTVERRISVPVPRIPGGRESETFQAMERLYRDPLGRLFAAPERPVAGFGALRATTMSAGLLETRSGESERP